MSNQEELLTMKELSEYLKVSRITINKWIAEGMPREVYGKRVIRYKLSEVLEWLSQRDK